MTATSAPRLGPHALVYLRLGRVSNLPTVWTNGLAASVLVGGDPGLALVPVLVALSLFYTGGMYLNDAFDREFDARRYPDRPIASGAVSATAVFALGGGQLIAAVSLVGLLAWARPGVGAGVVQAPVLALVLAGAIVYYDARHKTNRVAPFVMALCRGLVFALTGALVMTAASTALLVGAALAAAYVLGVTYIARVEQTGRGPIVAGLSLLALPVAYAVSLLGQSDPPVVPVVLLVAWVASAVCLAVRRGPGALALVIPMLIAGISLLDAVLIASVAGHAGTAWLAVGGCALTLGGQRVVSGTCVGGHVKVRNFRQASTAVTGVSVSWSVAVSG